MSLISVVFSFRNEEKVLSLLIERMRSVLDRGPHDYELIFVNDASTDKSVAVLAAEASKGGKIRLVDMARRFGVEECFLAGIEHSRGDAIILMYTDLQDPPELIPDMIAAWSEGADVVHMVRRSRDSDPWTKRLAAFIAYRLISWISDIRVPADAGDFKLISKRAGEQILRLRETDPYLRGLIAWIGFKQVSIDYDMPGRALGESKVPLFGRKAWTVFLTGFISFSTTPLWAILTVGVLASLVTAVGFTVVAMLWAAGIVGGTSPAILGILLLWSLMLQAMGWIGVYLSRIYKDVRGRPQYIVRDVLDLANSAGPSA